MTSPRDIAHAWLAAYNARDAEALLALYDENAENHQVAFGEPVCGRAALFESFAAFFRAFPDSETHPENIFVDGEWAIIEWRGRGTFLGPLGEHAPNGKTFSLRGCGFLRVVDGKIAFQRGYIDRHTWFSQLDLPVT